MKKHSVQLLICLFILTLLFSAGANENERRSLYLNPSAECGIFQSSLGEWSLLPARVVLSYTDSALILESDLHSAPGHRIKAAGDQDDSLSIFGGETFEFQVAPAGQNGTYYHFIYSPSGYLYSARKRDTGWNAPGMKKFSRFSGERWHFRLEIPFKDLGTVRPESGEIWRVNLARNAFMGKKRENTSLSGARDYHNIEEYNRLIFGIDPPTPVILRNISPGHDSCILHFAGKFAGPADLEYQTESLGEPAVLTGLTPENGLLKARISIWEKFIPLKSGSRVRLHLKNSADGSTIVKTRGIIPPKTIAPLKLDKFYYTLQDSRIQFLGGLAPRMTLTISRENKVLLHREQPAGSGSVAFSEFLPEGQPRSGRYILTLGFAKQYVSRIFYILDRLPDPGPLPQGLRLTISPAPAGGFTSAYPVLRKYLLYGDRPFYLFALSPSSPRKEFLQFPNAGNFSYCQFGRIRKNSPELFGMPGGRYISSPQGGILFPPENQYAENLKKYAASRTDAPGIHRIAYEAQIPQAIRQPDGNWIYKETDQRMLQAYQLLKKTNPGLLYSIHTDSATKVRPLAKACDIFEVSFYSSSYARNMFPNLQKDMEQLRRQVDAGKPVIFWLGGTIPDQECRTAEEIRYGVYLSILNGFSGNIIHMGHGYLPRSRSRLWSLLSGIHAEIESVYPAFAAGRDATGILGKLPEQFLWRAVHTADGKILMMVLNTTPVDRNFILPEAAEIRDYLTGQVLEPEDGRRRSFIAAYEPRVYLLKR